MLSKSTLHFPNNLFLAFFPLMLKIVYDGKQKKYILVRKSL